MSAPRNTIGHRLVKDAAWLDAVGKVLGAALGAVFRLPGMRAVKDVLHGRWPLGHPLHPAITDATVGGYTVVALLDVVFLATREPAIASAAPVVLTFSLLTASASVLTGLADWNETYGEERRSGLLHGLVMVLTNGIFATSLVLRARGADSVDPAIAFSLIGFVILAVGAYLGGEQVFGYGTQVNRQAWSDQSTKWQRLEVAASGLEDRRPVVARTKQGVDVFLTKLDGQIYAIANTCTHAGGPLHKGTWVGKDRCEIQCPWHQSRFCVKDGAAKGGPATFGQVAFETRVDGSGFVEVRAR